MSLGYAHSTTDFAPRKSARSSSPSWVLARIGGSFSPTLTAMCFPPSGISWRLTGRDQRPDFEDLVPDRDRAWLPHDGGKRGSQHAGADVAFIEIHLTLVQRVAALGEGLALEIGCRRVVFGNE